MAADPANGSEILVTGAGGALARQVIKRLRADHRIVAVDFRRQVRFGGPVTGYRGDPTRREFEDLFRDHRIDGVIHLGRLESDESTPERRYNANVLGTQRLLKLCARYKVRRTLILSTFYAYGASPYNPVLLTEDAPLKASGLTRHLVDSVELENLANVYLWKHPELNITLLRPCHIAGPKVRNSMSQLLERRFAPALIGFSPQMQFIHVDDMAAAVVLGYEQNKPGIYNVAPREWLAYLDVLDACGCRPLWIPSIPQAVPRAISALLRWPAFPEYLINYLKYPVTIDGSLFADSFGFAPQHKLADILAHYRRSK